MDVIPYQKNRLGTRIRTIWRRRLRPVWEDYYLLVIGGLAILTIIPGVIYLALRLSDRIFPSVKSFSSFYLSVLKLFAIPFYTYAIIKALKTIFRKEFQAISLKLTNNHVVVCGTGKTASLFTKAFYEDGYKVVLITNDKNISKLEQFRDLKILVLVGDPTDKELLQKARVHKAQYLVAVCENDGDDAKIATNARTLVSDSPHRVLTCLVHITNPHLCNLLKEREIMGQQGDSFRNGIL